MMDRVMKFSGRNLRLQRSLRRVVPLVGCCCLAGCSINPFGTKQEVREVRTSTAEDIKIVRGDIQRLQEHVNNLSVRLDRVSSAQEREILDLKSAVSSLDSRVTQASNSVLAEVDRKIAEQDAKRAADKNQLVAKINSVVERINALSRRVRTAPSPPSRGGETVSQKGFYYTVEEGDSLWGIASKFRERGVTVDAIRQANEMPSTSSRIDPGQKLFIPVKE